MPNLINPYIFGGGVAPPTNPPLSPFANFTSRNPLDNGTLPANGDHISAWTDTINAYTATQGTSGDQPIFTTGGLNGYPYIYFDGKTLNYDPSFVDDLLSPAQQFTMYCLFKIDNISGSIFSPLFIAPVFPNRVAGFTFLTTYRLDINTDITLHHLDVVATSPTSNYYVLCWRSDGTTLSIFRNGSSLGSANEGNTVDTSGLGGLLYCDPGQIASVNQVVCYNSAQSDGNVATVFDYFATEWNITY